MTSDVYLEDINLNFGETDKTNTLHFPLISRCKMNANSPAFIPDKLYDSGGCSPGGARGVLGGDARLTFQKLRTFAPIATAHL